MDSLSNTRLTGQADTGEEIKGSPRALNGAQVLPAHLATQGPVSCFLTRCASPDCAEESKVITTLGDSDCRHTLLGQFGTCKFFEQGGVQKYYLLRYLPGNSQVAQGPGMPITRALALLSWLLVCHHSKYTDSVRCSKLANWGTRQRTRVVSKTRPTCERRQE